MSPADRQAWRDLVVNVPEWPPLPVGICHASAIAAEVASGRNDQSELNQVEISIFHFRRAVLTFSPCIRLRFTLGR